MKNQVRNLGLGCLMLYYVWSCTPDTEMAGIQDISRLDQQDVIPLRKAYYGIEKQDQASSLARLHLGLGIYPYWGGAKTCQNGRLVNRASLSKCTSSLYQRLLESIGI